MAIRLGCDTSESNCDGHNATHLAGTRRPTSRVLFLRTVAFVKLMHRQPSLKLDLIDGHSHFGK